MTSVFYLYRDAPRRRRALQAPPGSAERYALYGLDQLAERGFRVRHNLERRPPGWARLAGAALQRALLHAGGYGGDFAAALASLRAANRADVVFSTVDTVGIPLALLARLGLVRRPFVYTAIGLPERLERLRGERLRRLYADALGRAAAIVAYSEHEAAVLRAWLAERGAAPPVEFVPFGVDPEAFRPDGRPADLDVVSAGADPHRDFELLLQVAERLPETRFHLVAEAERARALPALPANVALEADLPFEALRDRLARARVVALPVRENSYSGATTVLLQAMALGKPVVVTRTRAITAGYGLRDGENCRLVPPGDAATLEKALRHVLADGWHARALGASARRTVERELSWERYADRLAAIIAGAAGAPRDGRSARA
ncbi:MAG TPA: glycosyltransferase family 4 protein [Gaiellaceae bacterium]|nr:glycosyltransferase family 4 protein [Gaiellaceae bacterium]